MKRTAALCALALLCLAGFAGSALAGKGGDPGPPTPPGHSGSAPGQQKKAEPPPAQTTQGANPSKPAKSKPKPKTKSKTVPASSHAKAGKITICHRTGSKTNPYVQITVSANAWKAHRKHGDLNPVPAGGCPTGGQPGSGGGGGSDHAKITICHRTSSETNPFVVITISENAWPAHQQHGDIHPVPAGGCPTGGQPGAGGGGGSDHAKITICHRTGSETNPFVVITISENAWPAHQQHGDIHPVPAGGCPTPAAPTTTTAAAVAKTAATPAGATATTTATTATAQAPVVVQGTASTKSKSSVATTTSSKPAAEKGGSTAVADEGSETAVLGTARRLGATVRRQNLPFTGTPLWIPLLAGAALVATGVGLRRWRQTARIA
jgi:hypothetical protein